MRHPSRTRTRAAARAGIARYAGLPSRAAISSHHRGEERRLRAAEVVRSIAIGHVPISVDQPGEVPDHVDREIVAAALLEPEHREVRIPVIDLAEAAAGHDVAVRQRQERGVRPIGSSALRVSTGHSASMWSSTSMPGFERNSAAAGAGASKCARRMRRDRSRASSRDSSYSVRISTGGLTRQRIDERLAVLVDALDLDPLEEAGIQLSRRRRRERRRSARGAGDQPEQQPRGPGTKPRDARIRTRSPR